MDFIMTSDRIFGLDFLRFLAIMLVVVGHGLTLMPSFPEIKIFFRIFDFIGVELFFVLSGFLIGTIFLKTFSCQSSVSDLVYFWKRRWWRTLPNYYLFVLINFIGFSFLKDEFSFDWRYLFFLQNLIGPHSGFFSVSWSLTVEEWFYLSVPLVFIVGLRVFKSRAIAIWSTVGLVTVASLMARYQYVVGFDATWNNEIRQVAVLRLDSLIYGVAAAWLWLNHKEFLTRYKMHFFVLGVCFLGAGIVIRNDPEINQTHWMLLLLFPILSVGISCWLPVLAAWRSSIEGEGALARSIRNISVWSYSLYLVHVPAMEGFSIFVLPKILDNYFLQLCAFLIWIFLAIFASSLIYRFFEKPIMDMRDGVPDDSLIKSVLGGRRG
ncbi:acyltransferase [Marinobacter sp. Arc7-DN-1]|nr:acyltransferase [Marinobacter sp. Arc7-DN-1]